MLQLFFPKIYGEHEFEWQRQYGPLYRINGVFGVGLTLPLAPSKADELEFACRRIV
jgi:hypothetical protein